ncbi:MAG: hypothetical protein RIB93_17020 [Coleofasciculus sp. D1-CHI-01]|uniref:tetratricopeptide repeat protein n=1 Tax=Coleofasciculus sp. D1-CHI-01 TaxID=3068482 RepID=UPI003300190D
MFNSLLSLFITNLTTLFLVSSSNFYKTANLPFFQSMKSEPTANQPFDQEPTDKGIPLVCWVREAYSKPESEAQVWALLKVAHQYSAAGHQDKASEVLEQALEIARTVEDVQSKIKLLLQVASGYIDAEEFASTTPLLNSALQLTQTTTDEPAKLAFLTDIASQYTAASQKDKAADIVAQIEQLRETVDLNYFRQGSILDTLTEVYAELGNLEQALGIVNRAEDANFKASALTNIAQSYRKFGQENQAIELLDRAAKIADINSHTLAKIAQQYWQTGQEDKATQIAINLPDANQDVLVDIISQKAKRGDYSQALQLVPFFKGMERKVFAPKHIAEQYVEGGSSEPLSDIVATIKDTESRETFLGTIAANYIKNDQYDAALTIVEAINDAYYKAAVLTQLSLHYTASGDNNQATALLAQATEIAKNTDDYITIHPLLKKVSILTAIAGLYQAIGQQEKAAEVLSLAQKPLETLQASGENLQASGENLPIPDPNIAQSNHRLYWLQLAQNYTEAKQYDRALVTLRLVDDLATSKRLRTRLECANNL